MSVTVEDLVARIKGHRSYRAARDLREGAAAGMELVVVEGFPAPLW